MAEGNKAPYVIVRHRPSQGTFKHDIRVPRYWKSKFSGETIEVVRFILIKPDERLKVIFRDPTVGGGHELSAFLEDFKKDHEPIGNRSDKF